MCRNCSVSHWWCSCHRKTCHHNTKVFKLSTRVIVLLSANRLCFTVSDLHPKGGLLTLFLHSPLTAVCVLGNIKEVPYHLWETGQAFVDRFLAEASRLMTRAKGLGNYYCDCPPILLSFDQFARVDFDVVQSFD